MVVYADEVFAINALSDMLLLCAAACIGGGTPKYIKIAAVSVCGGIYAVFDSVYSLPDLANTAVLAAMTLAVFGVDGFVSGMCNVLTALIFSEAAVLASVNVLGGSARIAENAVSVFAASAPTLIVCLLAHPTLAGLRYFHKRRRRTLRLEFIIGAKKRRMRVLHDSGNLLKYNGRRVIIVSGTAAEIDTPPSDSITYTTIGGTGTMPLYIPEMCRLNGQDTSAVIAVTGRTFADGYGGITGD